MSSSSAQILLTSSPEGPITAFDASTGTPVTQFTGSRSPRRGLALAGKDFIAASHISLATGSGSIHLYTWYSSTALHNLPVPEPVAPLVATRDGSYLFAGGLSGNIHVFSLPSGDILRSFPAHNKPVSCLAISQDGSLLISGFDDGTIVLIPVFLLVEPSADTNSSDFTFVRFTAHEDSVTTITCTSTIISCSMDCTFKLWSLFKGTQLGVVTFPCPILGVALDPAETQFYAAGSDGSIYKGSLIIGKHYHMSQIGHELVILAQKHRATVVSMVIVNEGKTLASAAEDGSVFLWDTETGQVTLVLETSTGNISDMVVAGGISHCMNVAKCDHEPDGGVDGGLSAELLNRTPTDTVELEEVLMVAEKDRSKAIDILQSAIALYERLLELILKELRKG